MTVDGGRIGAGLAGAAADRNILSSGCNVIA
jgi:hypothetical protein